MTDRDVSVVIVSYNTGPILFRSIESVLTQDSLLELIIVDNGNPGNVRDKLRNIAGREPRLRIITNEDNKGFAAGCNLGAKNATGRYLLLLNPDCVIPANSISRVREELRSRDDVWLAGCCIVNPDGSEQSGSRRNLLTPWVAFVETFKLYRMMPDNSMIRRMNFHEMETYQDSSHVPAISGAFMMVAKKRYDELGGIDEGYFFHVEDLDFCYQVNDKGGKIIYVPDIKAVHFRSTSDVSEFFIEINKTKGFVRYFKKNFTGKYFPGFLWLMILGIYARFLVRMGILTVKYLLTLKFLRKAPSTNRSQTIHEKILASYENIKSDGRLKISTSDIKDYEPILLAGASGQVGIAILRRLLAMDTEVLALYHKKVIDFSHPKLKWLQGDLNTELLNIENIRPKTLIYTPPLWLLPPHLEKMAKLGVKRLICFSSTSIFGKAMSKNEYEKKLVARLVKAEKDIEEICRRAGIEWTIFRPTLIYGIGLDRNVSSVVKFINKFSFFPITKKGSGLRQPVHCDDLAIAALSTINLPSAFGKSYNIGGGEKISYRSMISRIFSVLSLRERIVSISFLPTMLDTFSAIFDKEDINGEIARRMNIDLVFDDTPARKDFGYQPREFLTAGKTDLGLEIV